MRITLVIGGLGGGGAERVCINLANSWVERGHEVTLVTISQNSAAPAYAIDPRVQRRDVGWPRRARQEELNAVAIEPVMRGLHEAGCAQQLTQHITLFALLRHTILSQRPDVVVSHLDITNLRVLAAMYDTNVPVIVCEHTDATRVNIGTWQNVRATLYPRARAIVTPHAESAEWFSEYDVERREDSEPFGRLRLRRVSSATETGAGSCRSRVSHMKSGRSLWFERLQASRVSFRSGTLIFTATVHYAVG